MSYELTLALVVLVSTMALLATEGLAMDVVALLVLGVLLISCVLSPRAVSGLSSAHPLGYPRRRGRSLDARPVAS